MYRTRSIDAPRPTGTTPRVRSLRAVDSTAPRCVWVRRISPALDFYLAVDCTVLHAADGWVRLGNASTTFILAHGPDPHDSRQSEVPALFTPDLAVTCHRLQALGIEPGPITHSVGTPSGRIIARDPDQHVVTVTQVDATTSTTTHQARRSSAALSRAPRTLT